ncbi:MAG: hypothetical protein R2844_11970 [Caldilineales bacterium]
MTTSFLNRFFVPRLAREPQALKPGMRQYSLAENGQTYRFHLRVDPGGSGLLISNGTAIAQLSATGVLIASRLLQGASRDAILRELDKQFEPASIARRTSDIAAVDNLIHRLISPEGAYPVFNLRDPAQQSQPAKPIPPLEADLTLDQPVHMLPIMDHLWSAGLPHITIRVPVIPDVVEIVSLVEHAQWLGLICGVSGRASDLMVGSIISDLALVGVDHITVFYASADPSLHDSLFGAGDHAAAEALFKQTAAAELADVAMIPLIQATVATFDETLARLHELEVPNASFYAIACPDAAADDGALPASALAEIADDVERAADAARVRFQWQPPVRRDPAVSLAEQVRAGARCSSDLAVRIDPDGSVIPPRGPYRSAGDVVRDPWTNIWQHAIFDSYRARIEQPTHCATCPGLAICAADCPKEPAGWSDGVAR